MEKSLSLYNFLVDRGQFTNSHDVSILLLGGGCVHLACYYPGARCDMAVNLEIVNVYASIEEMMDRFRIRSKIELNALTPLDLLEKYASGDMKVSCMVERKRQAVSLTFRWVGGHIVVSDDDRDYSQQVEGGLRSGDDYIAYTEAYFHLIF